MAAPQVTVLMPVYNGGRYLDEAIRSILTQTLGDLELIVINDGSTDDSGAIIERHQRRDKRVRGYEQPNCGLIDTLNRGLSLARGEYVARMDQDDISHPERLSIQVAFLNANQQVGICGAWIETIEGLVRHAVRFPTHHPSICGWLLFESVLAHPTVVMRRSVLSKMALSYDSACLHAEDYDLWVRASRYTALANVGQVLLQYRIHPDQIVRRCEVDKLTSARRVRQAQLERLGVMPSDEELDLHQALSTWQFRPTPAFLKATRAWFIKLKTANDKARLYQTDALSQVLGQRWAAVCAAATHLGWRTAGEFLRSPLRGDTGLSWKELAKLLLKCGIRRRQHA